MNLETVCHKLTRYLESVYIKPVEFGSGFQGHAFMGRFYGRNNACIGWPYEPIRSIVGEIRNQDNRISEKTIRALFQNAAVELVEENLVSEDGDPDADANVDSLLEVLLPELIAEKAKYLHTALSQRISEFQVYVPLQGIDLEIPELAIAGGILYPKNSSRISDQVRNTTYPEQVQNDIQHQYLNASAYYVCTEDGDEHTTVDFARARAREAIHLLRFYLTPDSLKVQREHFRIRLVGEPELDRRFVFICHSLAEADRVKSYWSQEAGPHKPYRLGAEAVDFMRARHYETLHRAMLNSANKKGEIAARIARAVRWFSYAVAAYEIEQKFVGYAVALESLLTDSAKPDPVQNWGSITQRLAECCAFLLSDEGNKRKEIEKEVKELYAMRSQIVHGGLPVSEANTHRIQVMARSAILAFASQNFSSWAAFLERITQLKYG